MEKKVVIIGNGISGVTAARHIRKLSNMHITMISDETTYFFSRTALMYIYMGHMKYEHTQPYENWFWKKNRIDLIKDRVTEVDTEKNVVKLNDGSVLKYDFLILATGSKPKLIGWPGQELKAVQGLYHIQDLHSMEHYSATTDRAVIVGGGLIGVEMAEMFLTRGIKVTFLVRESSFWNTVLPDEESAMINRILRSHNIDLRLNTELQEIVGDDKGRVSAIKTRQGETIDCQFVGLTIGVVPNIGFLKQSTIETDRGILVDQYLQTNVHNVYAIGDCTQQRVPLENRRPFEQVWYTGRIMGRTAAQSICGTKTAYEPGIWFNSAKFFDVEYQTYGWVFNKPREGESTFYWEHESGLLSLRFVYHKTNGHILGFNALGIRLRHKVCEQWILDKKPLDYVMENLKLANFDPEFYKQYEGEIVDEYNQSFGKNLKIKSRRKLLSWFASL